MKYKIIEESLSVMEEIVNKSIDDVVIDAKLGYALKGALLFFIQGLLDIANYVVVSRDMTPTSYRDIFGMLLNAKMIGGEFLGLLNEIVVMRNKLLFAYDTVDVKSAYEFVLRNLAAMRELYHKLVRLGGEVGA